MNTLAALGFTILLSTGNHTIAEKALPEVSEWATCPPPYYMFSSAGVRVEITGTEIHTHFWERRSWRDRYFFERDCVSTGKLEELLRK